MDALDIILMVADYKARGGRTQRCPVRTVAPTRQLRRKAFRDGSRTIN